MASAGWTLAFLLYVYGKTPITITASASGDDYTISVLPAVTRLWVSGVYSWQAYVYKSGGTPVLITEKYTIETGKVEILPDLTQSTSGSDFRSIAKTTLDIIEARLRGNTSPEIMAYSIAGRSVSKMNVTELIKLRSYFQEEYRRETEAEAIARGLDSPNRIGVRFRKI